MFNNSINRVGFACKWIDDATQVDGIKKTDAAREYNMNATTITWLNKQTPEVAEQKLWDLMTNNIEVLKRLITRVGALHENLRMVRLGSDVLAAYTEPKWRQFYHRSDVRQYCERHFGIVGDIARSRDVRISFHPGQFCVLASDNPNIVQRSIEEFEYHVDMARWMGYGQQFQDLKINVHISGRQGPEGVRKALAKMSPEARNCITIENDEISWGIDASLALVDTCALVLDIHHHWIHSGGEYIEPTDDRFKRIRDSWRGQRPVIHYSVSREDVLDNHCQITRPNFSQLIGNGYKKAHLRAHSDFYWNQAVNQWASQWHPHADIMCESKAKNLASFDFYHSYCAPTK